MHRFLARLGYAVPTDTPPAGSPRRERRPRLFGACLLGLALAVPAGASADEVDHYALDDASRSVAPRGRIDCPKVDLVHYKGRTVKYHADVVVHPAFVERLTRFEQVVRDVAVEVYGRAPARIHHLGTFSCRRIGGYPELLSEHSFGNAIDVDSFEFDGLPPAERRKSDLPIGLRGPFRVSVAQHWRGKGDPTGKHQRFLDELARRLVARKDVFRVLLGPSYPGHANHFHFDMAPYRMVAIWDAS